MYFLRLEFKATFNHCPEAYGVAGASGWFCGGRAQLSQAHGVPQTQAGVELLHRQLLKTCHFHNVIESAVGVCLHVHDTCTCVFTLFEVKIQGERLSVSVSP